MSFSNVFALDDSTYPDLDIESDEWKEASQFIYDSPQPQNSVLNPSTAPPHSSSAPATRSSNTLNNISRGGPSRTGVFQQATKSQPIYSSTSGEDSPSYPDLEFESDDWKEAAPFVYDSPRSHHPALTSNFDTADSSASIAPELTTVSHHPRQNEMPQVGGFLQSSQPQGFYSPEPMEQIPNAMPLMDNYDSSGLMFGTNVRGFNDTVPTDVVFSGLGVPPATSAIDGYSANSLINAVNSPSSSTISDFRPQFPCRLEVKRSQDKIRVETQNPTTLILYDAPKYVTKLRLPSHTIFKPANQVKSDFDQSEDTLELSTMVFSATAMQKEGLMEQAFRRAASGEVPVGGYETRQTSAKKVDEDENDPRLPSNGAPLAICDHCIKRERKRAARGKNKHIEEDEDWLKDEAKRIIIFNCKEVVDWCVPGQDKAPVKNASNPTNVLELVLPMRIACYCRHQGEKLGFRVVFTVKTWDNQILAQAMSEPMMITDDHKQPVQSGTRPGNMRGPSSKEDGFMMDNFGEESRVMQHFNKSWSTNDLSKLAASRRPSATFGRHHSNDSETGFSTTTTTPRNLSRPASPTSPSGHSTKKRRSGGADKAKLLSQLRMTQKDDVNRSSNSMKWNNGLNSAGLTMADLSFPDGGLNTTLVSSTDGYPTNQMAALDPFRASEPPTPITGIELDQTGAPRSNFGGFFGSSHLPPDAAAEFANIAPPGYNPGNPPMIQKVVPNYGPITGGTEVSILGKSFFQGLDPTFGNVPGMHPTYWSPTTLLCTTPPANSPGTVPVRFGFQQELDRLNIGPPQGRPVMFTYQNEAQLQSVRPQMAQPFSTDRSMFDSNVAMPEYMRSDRESS